MSDTVFSRPIAPATPLTLVESSEKVLSRVDTMRESTGRLEEKLLGDKRVEMRSGREYLEGMSNQIQAKAAGLKVPNPTPGLGK